MLEAVSTSSCRHGWSRDRTSDIRGSPGQNTRLVYRLTYDDEYRKQRYQPMSVTFRSPWNVQGLNAAIRRKWNLPGQAKLTVSYKAVVGGMSNPFYTVLKLLQIRVLGQRFTRRQSCGWRFRCYMRDVRWRTRRNPRTETRVLGSLLKMWRAPRGKTKSSLWVAITNKLSEVMLCWVRWWPLAGATGRRPETA